MKTELPIEKFIYLMALYAEVGVNFTDGILDWKKSVEWCQILNKNIIPEGKMSINYSGYTLTLTLSSSIKISDLVLKGPKIDRRNKDIGYVIYIPYQPVVSDNDKIGKLTEYFKEGVMKVLKELNYPDKSILKSVEGIKQ
jgi:hypothetical protein